jgi:hypothetical protein
MQNAYNVAVVGMPDAGFQRRSPPRLILPPPPAAQDPSDGEASGDGEA